MEIRQREREEREEAAREILVMRLNLHNDYAKTFGTEHGRRVLTDIINSSFIWRTSFTNSRDTSSFNEGVRASLLAIADNIPGIYAECVYKQGQSAEQALIDELNSQKKELDKKKD